MIDTSLLSSVSSVGFFSSSNPWILFAVNIVILIGGIGSTAAFIDRRKKRAIRKKNDDIQAAVGVSVEDYLLRHLNEAVDTSVDEIVDNIVKEKFDTMQTQIDKLVVRTEDNGGSSITDSQKRMEISQERLEAAVGK
jgi:xylose isomerase